MYNLRPPIFDSIKRIDVIDTLRALVEKGADINIEYKTSTTRIVPLFEAIKNENVAAIQYLLENGARISAFVDKIGDNLFMSVIRMEDSQKKIEVIKEFLKRPELQANFINEFSKKNVLMLVTDIEEDLTILDLLLQDQRFLQVASEPIKPRGTLLDYVFSRSVLGSNPIANSKGATLMIEFITYLQKKGMRISKLDYSPFTRAIDVNAPDLIDLCIRIGADINEADSSTGFTPLTYAIQNEFPEMVRYLLEKGANPNLKDANNLLPITSAIYTANLEIIQLLMKDTAMDELQGTEMILTVIKTQNDSEKVKSILHYFVDELGYNPFGANVENIPALILASSLGNEGAVEFLLEKGANVNETIGRRNLTAYDIAANAKIRLLLALYLEQDRPKFTGYLKDDTLMFDLFWGKEENDPVHYQRNTALCPICFGFILRSDACMYVNHDCVSESASNPTIHVHRKLYDKFRSNTNRIEWCILCNRLCSRHQHTINTPTLQFDKAIQYARGGDPFDRTCYSSGGGDMPEKITRWQRLLEHMCFMNENYIGKISMNMAKCIAKELFIEAGSKLLPKETIDRILANQAFEPPCEFPVATASAAAAVAAVEEVVVNYPNVPRHPNNVGLLPVRLPGEQRQCEYHTTIHGPDTDLFQFFHRQPAGAGQAEGGIFNHENSFICQEGLEEFIQYLCYDKSQPIKCFDTIHCKGHFHPSEIQGIVDDDVYEEYRKRYNQNPPRLRFQGGARKGSLFYILSPNAVESSCALPKRQRLGGRYKVTRKSKLQKKTRKARRYNKTRKH
jgi:ankyrin repeat protein